MSQTFTLPLTAADQFNHGHDRRHSRSHQRQSRLAPPFPLPRIPSGSTVPAEQTVTHHDHTLTRHDPSHRHSHHGSDSDGFSRAPIYDADKPLLAKKRSFEARNTTAVMAHQHRHVSKPTDILLHATENYSLFHSILADKETRRIFYFMVVNLAFMVVQSTYGFLTGSLGLISDSIHMFFDCVALLVGVCAAVMSKWPPSSKFPYGYGKIDTLAGLGNGIFLMLISIEIVYEAMERLFSGSEVNRTSELLVVSILGLGVNMIGIFCFHGHHGHDHGHSHGHDHSHDSLDHRRPSNAASASPTKTTGSDSHAHHHHHGGENMQGIYLHILADALGSVAVVVSTLLVQWTGWSGFDPLASCIIAVLIFISTIPLVSSTTKILLLSLNSDIEYNLRDILGGISSIRGVVGYTVPKFWLEDIKKDPHDHHHHGHNHTNDSHGHSHSHDHDCHHGQGDHHDHGHSHSHSHHSDSHSHPHDHDHDDNHDSHSSDPIILGTIHIQISIMADLRDVQSRISSYFQARKMDVIVQYEREGENKCWCIATNHGIMKTPPTGGMRTPLNASMSFPSGFGFMIGNDKAGPKGSPLGKML